MKKLVVNEDACISCGLCVSQDEEHFAFNDDMHSHVISQDNLDSPVVKDVIASCPTGAISFEECDGSCEHCQEEGE